MKIPRFRFNLPSRFPTSPSAPSRHPNGRRYEFQSAEQIPDFPKAVLVVLVERHGNQFQSAEQIPDFPKLSTRIAHRGRVMFQSAEQIPDFPKDLGLALAGQEQKVSICRADSRLPQAGRR